MAIDAILFALTQTVQFLLLCVKLGQNTSISVGPFTKSVSALYGQISEV